MLQVRGKVERLPHQMGRDCMQETLLALFTIWWLGALLIGKSGRAALLWSAPVATLVFWLLWLAAQNWGHGLDPAVCFLCFALSTLAGLLAGLYSRRALGGLIAGVDTGRAVFAAPYSQRQTDVPARDVPAMPRVQMQAARPARAISTASMPLRSRAAREPSFRPIVEAIGGSLAATYNSISTDLLPEPLNHLLKKIDEVEARAA
jgi:hypothetical protein